MKRSLIALAGLTVTSAAADSQFPRNRARPGLLPGVPTHPYQTVEQRVPDTVTIVSLSRVTAGSKAVPATLENPAPAGDNRLAAFQMLESRVQIDHCFLSNVAVSFKPDGSYAVSLRADQNPKTNDDVRSPLKPGEKPQTTIVTSGLRRNTFHVRIRAYGTAPLREPRPNAAPSKPSLFDLTIDPFIVERGQPYTGTVNGTSDLAKRNFELIDRVEIEFTYR